MKMPLRAVHNLIRVAASVSLLGVVAATQPGVALAACSRTATATSGTLDWSLTSSWSGGLVPTAADDVCLPTGTETVKLDNTTVAAANSIVVSLGSKLQIGDGAATTLTVATTIANDGTLQIGKTGNVNLAQLVVTSGILLNNPTGTTQTLGTASQLDLNLTNLGTFTATGPVSFGKANSTINNSGTWTNTSQVDMSGGAGQSVNVNGGSFGGSQNFVMSGGTFDHTGGTVSEVILRGVTLKPESPTGGGTFIVAISGNTLATDISAGETVIVAGGYTTQDGVLGSAVDRINNGTLILRSDGAPHTGKVVFTAGAKLTNNGTITSSNSNLLGGDARVLEAPVINNGTINVNYDLDFDQALATIVQGSGRPRSPPARPSTRPAARAPSRLTAEH